MVKRLFDLLTASVGLGVLFVPLAGIALGVKLSSSGPVFYRGVRVGLHGRVFRIFKFRTMVANADAIGGPSTADDDPRITRIGRRLRKYKLDELPQLLNVLAGDMSLVGPRPEVPAEVATYNEEQRQLLTVRPGITDYASLKFRNEGEILKGASDAHRAYRELIQPEKIRLGLEYVRHPSFGTDLRILFLTLKAILTGS